MQRGCQLQRDSERSKGKISALPPTQCWKCLRGWPRACTEESLECRALPPEARENDFHFSLEGSCMLKNKAVSPDTGAATRRQAWFQLLEPDHRGFQPSGALTQELLTCLAPRSASSRFPAMSWVKESFFTDAWFILIYFIRPRCLLPSLGVPITKYSTHWPEWCSGPSVKNVLQVLCAALACLLRRFCYFSNHQTGNK